MTINVILLIFLAILVVWAVRGTIRKARKGSGCCGEFEEAEKKVCVADHDKRHYPYSVSLKIGGMTCETCARKVENALNRIDGVWADVSISSHTAKILCMTRPEETVIREAIRNAGYVVTEYNI